MNKAVQIVLLSLMFSVPLFGASGQDGEPVEEPDNTPRDNGFLEYDTSTPSGRIRPLGYGYGFFEPDVPVVSALDQGPALDDWARAPKVSNPFLVEEYNAPQAQARTNPFLSDNSDDPMAHYLEQANSISNGVNIFMNTSQPNVAQPSLYLEYERVNDKWWIKRR